MIYLSKNGPLKVVLTLSERTSETTVGYLFSFEHRTTKEVVELEVGLDEDLSGHPYRHNDFTIDASAPPFTTATVGQWTYQVFGIDDENPEGYLIETGVMLLEDDTPIEANEVKTFKPENDVKVYRPKNTII